MSRPAKLTADQAREACNKQIADEAMLAMNEYGEGTTFLALVTNAITIAQFGSIPQPLVESIMTKAMAALREWRRENPS